MKLSIEEVNTLIKFFEQLSFNFTWDKNSLSYTICYSMCINDINSDIIMEFARVVEKKKSTFSETFVIEGTKKDPVLSKFYDDDIYTILMNTYGYISLHKENISKISIEPCKIKSKIIIISFLEQLYSIENDLKS